MHLYLPVLSRHLLPILHNVARIVAMDFFWDKHFDQDIPRRSSYEWLIARLPL